MVAAPDAGGPDEPLEQSAPLAWRLAAQLCRRNEAGESCAWYHGAWQLLRLLGLVDTPRLDAGFYPRALPDTGRVPRILICGAADYGILAQLAAGLALQGRQATITVIDWCSTPLKMNQWYARRSELELHTEQTDIFEYEPSEPFDLVCAHSLLVLIPGERRAQLTARWRALLRPGGMLAIANRVWPSDVPEVTAYTEAELHAYCDIASKRAAALAELPGLGRSAILGAVEHYARNRRLHVLRSTELEELLQAAGFHIEELSQEAAGISARRGMDGGPAHAQRLRCIARRL